eukprot:COSAG06_NODE_431_length_15859_cov_19.762500_7_plen_99_part_00
MRLSIPGGQEDGRGARGDDNDDHHGGGGGDGGDGNEEEEGEGEQSVNFVPGRSSVGSGTGTAGRKTPQISFAIPFYTKILIILPRQARDKRSVLAIYI